MQQLTAVRFLNSFFLLLVFFFVLIVLLPSQLIFLHLKQFIPAHNHYLVPQNPAFVETSKCKFCCNLFSLQWFLGNFSFFFLVYFFSVLFGHLNVMDCFNFLPYLHGKCNLKKRSYCGVESWGLKFSRA